MVLWVRVWTQYGMLGFHSPRRFANRALCDRANHRPPSLYQAHVIVYRSHTGDPHFCKWQSALPSVAQSSPSLQPEGSLTRGEYETSKIDTRLQVGCECGSLSYLRRQLESNVYSVLTRQIQVHREYKSKCRIEDSTASSSFHWQSI